MINTFPFSKSVVFSLYSCFFCSTTKTKTRHPLVASLIPQQKQDIVLRSNDFLVAEGQFDNGRFGKVTKVH